MDFDTILLSGRLPDSIAADSRIAACAKAVDPQLYALFGAAQLPALYTRFNALTSAQLDHLAVQFDITGWQSGWNIAKKRSVFLASYRNKRRMGTLAAVREVLEAFGAGVRIIEWWEPDFAEWYSPGAASPTPHTFTVQVSFSAAETLPTADLQAEAMALIDMAKPVRSHYQMLIIDTLSGESAAITGITPRPQYAELTNI